MTALRRLGIATRGFRGGGGEIVRIGYIEDSLTAKIQPDTLQAKLSQEGLTASISYESLNAKIENANVLTLDLTQREIS